MSSDGQAPRVFASANSATEVTLSDTTFQTYDALYIGTPGDGTLKVTTTDNEDVSFAGVVAGFFPVAVRRVWSTGTGASDIVGLKW